MPFLKSEQLKTTKKQSRNRTPAAPKIRENTWFSSHFWKKREEHNAHWITQKRKKCTKTRGSRWILRHGRPLQAPESRLDPQVGSRKAKTWGLGARKHPQDSRPHAKKRAKTRGFCNVLQKSNKIELNRTQQNQRSVARPRKREKRAKTRGVNHFFTKRACKNDEKTYTEP